MTNHLQVYMQCQGIDDPSEIVCELSGLPAQDIHHLDPRGMGGSKLKDTCENLQALTRMSHDIAEKYPHLKGFFQEAHESFQAFNKPLVFMDEENPILNAIFGVETWEEYPNDRQFEISNFGNVRMAVLQSDNSWTYIDIPRLRHNHELGVMMGTNFVTIRKCMALTYFGSIKANIRQYDGNLANFCILNLIKDENG